MRRILVTGLSGVGKSTVVGELAARGYRAVDLDSPSWSEWRDSPDGGPTPERPGQDWVWQEDAVRGLLGTGENEVLIVGGCAANQGLFYEFFDDIVLLSAPAPVMVDRLTSRRSGSYGSNPGEVERSLSFKESVEPRLRAVADLEIDTTAAVDAVVAAVLAVISS